MPPRDVGVSSVSSRQDRGVLRDRRRPRDAGLRLVEPGERRPTESGTPAPGTSRQGTGMPCRLSLTSRDVRAAERFYGRVLGWCHVPLLGSPGRPRSLLLKAGEPVGTLSGTTCDLGVHAGWLPYFAVGDVDDTVGRLRERGATVAVGPLSGDAGRVAVVAGPDDAVFGIRQQAPDGHWTVGDGAGDGAVVRVELFTRDIFAAALFYGGVLGWASGAGGCCGVEYADERIVVRDGPRTVAVLRGGTAPGTGGRHRWHACFRVADVDAAVAAAVAEGGRVITPPVGPRHRREAVLADREGMPFTVVAG